MFNAYGSNSTQTIISASSAKRLIEKLLILDAYDKPKLEFEIGYKKYPGYADLNRSRNNFQIFTEAQAKQLCDFLNKNNIKCEVKEREVAHYSPVCASNGLDPVRPHALAKIIIFPGLKTKDELLAKLRVLYPEPAPQSASNALRG